jgi:hypothetical protein
VSVGFAAPSCSSAGCLQAAAGGPARVDFLLAGSVGKEPFDTSLLAIVLYQALLCAFRN